MFNKLFHFPCLRWLFTAECPSHIFLFPQLSNFLGKQDWLFQWSQAAASKLGLTCNSEVVHFYFVHFYDVWIYTLVLLGHPCEHKDVFWCCLFVFFFFNTFIQLSIKCAIVFEDILVWLFRLNLVYKIICVNSNICENMEWNCLRL